MDVDSDLRNVIEEVREDFYEGSYETEVERWAILEEDYYGFAYVTFYRTKEEALAYLAENLEPGYQAWLEACMEAEES